MQAPSLASTGSATRFTGESPEVAAVRALVFDEAVVRLGRDLTEGERHIDLLAVTAALEAAKERLRLLIEAEKRRAIREWARSGGWFRVQLGVTEPMVAVLRGLYALGKAEARAEIRSRGLDPEAAAYAAGDPLPPRLDDLVASLHSKVAGIGLRVEREAITADLSGLGVAGIVRELDRLAPGALDAASRVVSGAFDGGLGGVYEQTGGLFESWVYSAIGDAAMCANCRAYDGAVFASWEAIQAVLPGGGPNPSCFGDGRCRCRAVPGDTAPAPASAPAAPFAPLEPAAANGLLGVDYKAGFASLRGSERQALEHYQGSGYRVVNDSLRDEIDWSQAADGGIAEREVAERVEAIEDALNANPTNYDLTVYRGAGRATPERLIAKFGTDDLSSLVGTSWKDEGFLSTTLDEMTARGFGRVMMQIDVPKGTPAFYMPGTNRHVYSVEQELLLPPGTELRIVEVIEEPDPAVRWLLRMEVVPSAL